MRKAGGEGVGRGKRESVQRAGQACHLKEEGRGGRAGRKSPGPSTALRASWSGQANMARAGASAGLRHRPGAAQGHCGLRVHVAVDPKVVAAGERVGGGAVSSLHLAASSLEGLSGQHASRLALLA